MSPLEKLPGIHAELASLLMELGIHEVTDLAQADATRLAKDLEIGGRKRGRASTVPGLISVKLFIQAAREKLAPAAVATIDLEEIPEAHVDRSHDDIPEAIMEHPVEAILVRTSAPPAFSAAQSSEFGGLEPRRPPVNSFSGTAETNVPTNTWKGVEQSRFQTLDDYAEGGRGIQPLKRTQGSREAGPAKLSNTKGQALPRTTRRGVLYPWPFKAMLGAFVAIVWRFGLILTCIALPYYSFIYNVDGARPISETLIWLGTLTALGFVHIWFINHARCRVCSCHLFYSKRCFKNSRAHLIHGLGYVTSLALHLLIFQWFRCMYCGTAIRLFSARAHQAEPAESPPGEAEG